MKKMSYLVIVIAAVVMAVLVKQYPVAAIVAVASILAGWRHRGSALIPVIYAGIFGMAGYCLYLAYVSVLKLLNKEVAHVHLKVVDILTFSKAHILPLLVRWGILVGTIIGLLIVSSGEI